MSPLRLPVLFLLAIAQYSLACPGCPKEATDQEAYKYVSDKLSNLKTFVPKGMESEEKAELVRIYKVEKKVVSGNQLTYEFEARGLTSNTLYDCRLVVFTQVWKHLEKIVDYTCHPALSGARALLGEEVPLDITDNAKLEQLKPLIGQEVAKSLNTAQLMKVTGYLKATQQVVAGTLIRATVKVASTNCLQKESSDTDKCHVDNKGRHLCEVHVWSKPWLNMQEVTIVQCEPQPMFCAGCPFESSPNDRFVKQSLQRTLSNLNAQPHSTQKYSLVKINKVVSQVISGMKYTVEFDAIDLPSKAAYSCKAVIISQPWITEEPIVSDFHCTPNTAY